MGWHLDHNKIDDRGFAALFDHLPSLLPKLGCSHLIYKALVFDGNPVSPEMAIYISIEE